MTGWSHHLIIAPILLPLVAGAVLLFIDERDRTLKALVSLAATLLLVGIALTLFRAESGSAGREQAYLLGTGVRLSASCWCSIVFRRLCFC